MTQEPPKSRLTQSQLGIDKTSKMSSMPSIEDSDVVAKPITSLEQAWKWQDSSSYLKTASIALKQRSGTRFRANQPRTLVCHDMKGGYLGDRYVQGIDGPNNYRFFHWAHVDLFVYFSHSFLTIPPPSWIDAGHLHGVPVLGTLITEEGGGTEICKKLFNGENRYFVSEFIRKLVDIAKHYKFDGWLINIENAVEVEHILHLQNFLHWLTVKMQEVSRRPYVIWYDSVTAEGQLIWQNELNFNNKLFFDACDGIYLNYNWDAEKLAKSAQLAGKRAADVYVGVDVFGRGTPGGGGFNCDVAFKSIRNANLSVALFAPGWVHEVLGEQDFMANEYKYWSQLAELSPLHGPASEPFSTSFCQGFGNRHFRYGKILPGKSWTNQSLQQYQPSYQSFYNKENVIHRMRVTSRSAYNGGGCLEITGPIQKEPIPVFRLFASELPFKVTLLCTYTFKCLEPAGVDINLIMKMVDKNGSTENWLLTYYDKPPPHIDFKRQDDESPRNSPHPVKVIHPANKEVAIDLIRQGIHFPSEPENGWIKRCYVLNPEKTEVFIKKISLHVDLSSAHEPRSENYIVHLGQVQLIPLHSLIERRRPLHVACSHVAIGRVSSSAVMEVSCILTWSGGNEELLDVYDVHCRVVWKDPSGLPQSETRFVDCTRRQAYKMTAFPTLYPGIKQFDIHFVVQEHLVGVAPTDVNQSAFAKISFV